MQSTRSGRTHYPFVQGQQPVVGKNNTATRRRTRLADSGQHVSIIQHPKTPRSKNVQTGALEGRSGTSIYPTGMLGYAQLLFTRTRTHTETAPQNQNFTPYALARTASGRTVCHPERSEGSGRTVHILDEWAVGRMNGHVGLCPSPPHSLSNSH